MSFNELTSVEQTPIQKLSGVNLNAAAPSSSSGASLVKEDAAVHGSFLGEALIRINPRIRPAQEQAVIAIGAFIAFAGLQSTPKPDRLES